MELFRPRRRAKFEPTKRHDDRGGPYYSCTSEAYSHTTHSFAAQGSENLRQNAPPKFKPYNS